MRASCFFSCLAAVLSVTPLVSVSGQNDSTSQSATLLAAYQAEQAVLQQAEEALVDSGATAEQVQAWYEQNATSFAAQQQLAMEMAMVSELDFLSLPGPPVIPADASPTLATFLTTQAAFATATAQIHNQLVQALPADVTLADILQMEQQQVQMVQQQLAGELAPQAQAAQTLAQESDAEVMPLPGPSQIPADATPQLQAFLVARDQLMRAEITVRNQYAAGDPATRRAALRQWRQQNAYLFAQLQQLVQTLTQNS